MNSIDATLAQRESTYGDYADVANVSQWLQETMAKGKNWDSMENYQKESLQMIANKIARIVTGNAKYHDSWHDIGGYAKLVADRLL